MKTASIKALFTNQIYHLRHPQYLSTHIHTHTLIFPLVWPEIGSRSGSVRDEEIDFVRKQIKID